VAYRTLAEMTDQNLYTALESGAIEYCVTKSAVNASGACGAGAVFDDRGLLQAQSYSYLDGYSPIDGAQVSLTGTGSVFVDYQINMLGESEMIPLKLENYHLQEALKRGILPASNIN